MFSGSDSSKYSVSVSIERDLFDQIDYLSDDFDQALTQGLKLWRLKEIVARSRRFYDHRSSFDLEKEEQWLQLIEEQLNYIWGAEDGR